MTKERIKEIEQRAEYKGWCACLDSVRASLKDYPNGGGDVEIMKEVERLCEEAAYSQSMRESGAS